MKTQVCKADAPGAFRSPAWPQGDLLRVTRSEPLPLALGSGSPLPSQGFSAEREPSGVDVHFGDANELERCGKAEGGCQRGVAEEVGQLIALLQLIGSIVEHPPVQAAGLLNLQLVDVSTEAHELPGQLLVLEPHLCLEGQGQTWVSRGVGPAAL